MRYTASTLLVLALLSGAESAQTQEERPWRPPDGVGEITFLGANTLIAAISAGVLQELRGGSFRDGFARGALGGAIVYGGKRLAVERFYGAGFLGREVAALGGSIVRNAAEGRPSTDRLMLPLGPLRVYLKPHSANKIHVKVNLYELMWTSYAIAEPALSFDAAKSFSAGAPVFYAKNQVILSDGDAVGGVTGAGTILLSGRRLWSDEDDIFAHERVHVLQHDFQFQAWTAPLDGWWARKVPLAANLNQYIDFDVSTTLLFTGLDLLFDPDLNGLPAEIEADFLELR